MAKKELEHMRISPSKNGGMTVRHEYKRSIGKKTTEPMGIGYDRPEDEEDVFGPGDHDKAMAHIGKHIGMCKASAKEESNSNEKEPDNDEDDK